MRGATSKIVYDCLLDANISIHAPREGSDPQGALVRPGEVQISIHAPREGSDVAVPRNRAVGMQFLSTLPVRGATTPPDGYDVWPEISIHAPREGSDFRLFVRVNVHNRISIHAPREGSDTIGAAEHRVEVISIHAPREGSDAKTPIGSTCCGNFYPRSP